MKPVARSLTMLTFAAMAAGCGDGATSPPGTPARPPALAISDGAHGGGNPGFFFLPPVVSDPSGNPEFGDSPRASVSPVVRVCRLGSDPTVGPAVCAEEVVSFSGAQVSFADGVYQVNWDTKVTELSTSAFYRMSVYVGTQMLGFADVDPVTSREMRNPRSGDVFTLLDGRTLPIKFVVEQDGLCSGGIECTIATVTNAGGSFVLPSGNGGIYLPEGWLPPGITSLSLTLQRVATGPDNDCLEDGFTGPGLVRQYEGCMKITTDPDLTGTAGIQQPAVVGLCLEIPSTHPDYPLLSMIKSDAGRPLEVLDDADPSVITGFTCAGFAGSPPPPEVIGWLPAPVQQLAATAWRGALKRLDRIELVQSAHAIDLGAGGRLEEFSDFSHFGWGLHATMSAVGSSTVSAPLGEYTTLGARVLANHVEGAPSQSPALQNVPVTFTITSTAGGQMAQAGSETYTAGPLTVLTDEAGDARIDFLPGATAGTYTIVATADALGAPITFTVNAGSFTIDFETWSTANGPCSPSCALSSQYSPNAQFFFMPDGGPAATVVPAARVEGGPYHAVTNHSATAPVGTAGFVAGTLGMTLGGDPTQATFRIRYATTGVTPQVTAYAYDPIDGVVVPVEGAVTFTLVDILAPSGAPAREAAVTVSISTGIYRIEISGGTTAEAIYLDDITITGAVFPPIG